MPVVDADFQQIQTVEKSKAIAWLHLMIGFLKVIQDFPPKLNAEPPGIQLVKHFFGHIGDQVPKMIYPQYIAYDLFLGGLDLPGHHSLNGLERPPEVMDGCPTRYLGRNGRQNIPCREGAVLDMDICKLDNNPRILIRQHAEHAVIRPYKNMLVEFDPYIAIRDATGTVDGHQMDGSLWKFLINRSQGKGSLGDIVKFYFMGNVDDNKLGVNGKHFCLHCRYIKVGISKIREECY